MRVSKSTVYLVGAIAIVASTAAVLHAALHKPFLATTVNIPYQGFLQNNGIPFNQPANIKISLYDGVSTTSFWQDTFTGTNVNSGHFSVVLGSQAVLDPGYLNGTPVNTPAGAVTVTGPINVMVSVNGTDLAGKQVLYLAPYAQVANYALQSSGEFDVGGALTAQGNATLYGTLNAGSTTVSGTLSAGATTVGALTATSVSGTPVVNGSVTTHPLTLGDNLTVTGGITAGGDITTSGSVKPQYDSGWVYVTNTQDHTFSYGWSDTPPSQMMLLQCGRLANGGTPSGNPKNFDTCTTHIVYAGTRGYQDGHSGLNPVGITVFPLGTANVEMYSGWWAWGYRPTADGNFVCSDTGATPADPSCDTAFYRLLVWK